MNIEEFSIEFLSKVKELKIDISEKEVNLFYEYMNLLIEWNKKINLTAITDEKDIILKHFIDSLTINEYIYNKENILDIGTGAGFPGIPLKIVNPESNFILVDSLNKRINFLEEVKNKLQLEKLDLIHSRAEDLAKDINYREMADIVVSRAVSNMRVLVEYMLPFVKVNGVCICMKGPNVKEELDEANKAIELLGGKIEKIENINLANNELERNIILIRKVKNTPSKYPRKAGIPVKQPL